MGTHPIFESDFDCLTENMCAGGFYCTRLSLTFLNILYLAVSFIIIGVAGYFRNVGIIVSTPLVGGILALGVMLTFISLLGIMATLRHHQVLLFFYVLVLFILFIVQFAVSISCLALSHLQQMEVVRTAWTNVRDDVREDAMRTLQCCGFTFIRRSLIILANSKYSSIKGIKIKITGRFNGAPRSKTRMFKINKLPVQTFQSSLDYSQSVSYTSNGT